MRVFGLVPCVLLAASAFSIPTWGGLNAASAGRYWAKAVFVLGLGPSRLMQQAARTNQRTSVAAFRSWVAQTERAQTTLGRPIAPWFYESTTSLSLARPEVCSWTTRTLDYSGGAHPNTFLRTANYGVVDGRARPLELADLFGGRTQEVLDMVVRPKLLDAKRVRGATSPTPVLSKSLGANWLATSSGISWIFSPYDVGPYAEGSFVVKASWADLSSFLKPSHPLNALARGR